jgi:hypothetical protein
MSDPAKDKKVRKAYRRFVAEVAAAQGVPADSDRAAEMAFYFTGGAYQAISGKSCLQALHNEVKAAHAANATRAGKHAPVLPSPPSDFEVASMDDVPEPERLLLLEKFREEMRAQGKTDEEITKIEAEARAFERAHKGAVVRP